MKKYFIESARKQQTGFVRLGGLMIILGLIIHIIANMVLKTFPPEDLTSSELQIYLSDEKGTWAIVHGIRYIAIVCIIIFSTGLFVKTYHTPRSLGWGIVGLLGAAMNDQHIDHKWH